MLGLTFAPMMRHPAYLPIDEQVPLQVEDPYAHSKQVDELTSELMWKRHGMTVVALRLPFLGGLADTIATRAERVAIDPGSAPRRGSSGHTSRPGMPRGRACWR